MFLLVHHTDDLKKPALCRYRNIIPKIFLLLCLLFAWAAIQAQDQPKDVNYYFDDGGVSSARNILKAEPILMLRGEYAAGWEFLWAHRLSTEVSAAYLSRDFHFYMINTRFLEENRPGVEAPGWCIGVAQTLYASGHPDGSLIQLGFKHYRFNEFRVNDFYTATYIQLILDRRFPLQGGFALGIHQQKSFDGVSMPFDEFYDIKPYFQVILRIGVLF